MKSFVADLAAEECPKYVSFLAQIKDVCTYKVLNQFLKTS